MGYLFIFLSGMSARAPPIDTLNSSPRALAQALVVKQGFYQWLSFHVGRTSDPHGGSPRGLEGVMDSFEGCVAFVFEYL